MITGSLILQTFLPFVKQTHRLCWDSSNSVLGGENLWIQEWPPAATVQCNWPFSDLWLAAWGGTPQKAKAQLKIEVEPVHLNISSSRKRPQSFIGRLKLTSTLCQFFGWGFFFVFWFFISCTTLAHSTPKTTLSHSNCQGKTWGGKIRVTSSLRARLYRKNHWTTPSLGFIGWQERLSLP